MDHLGLFSAKDGAQAPVTAPGGPLGACSGVLAAGGNIGRSSVLEVVGGLAGGGGGGRNVFEDECVGHFDLW